VGFYSKENYNYLLIELANDDLPRSSYAL